MPLTLSCQKRQFNPYKDNQLDEQLSRSVVIFSSDYADEVFLPLVEKEKLTWLPMSGSLGITTENRDEVIAEVEHMIDVFKYIHDNYGVGGMVILRDVLKVWEYDIYTL